VVLGKSLDEVKDTSFLTLIWGIGDVMGDK